MSQLRLQDVYIDNIKPFRRKMLWSLPKQDGQQKQANISVLYENQKTKEYSQKLLRLIHAVADPAMDKSDQRQLLQDSLDDEKYYATVWAKSLVQGNSIPYVDKGMRPPFM